MEITVGICGLKRGRSPSQTKVGDSSSSAKRELSRYRSALIKFFSRRKQSQFFIRFILVAWRKLFYIFQGYHDVLLKVRFQFKETLAWSCKRDDQSNARNYYGGWNSWVFKCLRSYSAGIAQEVLVSVAKLRVQTLFVPVEMKLNNRKNTSLKSARLHDCTLSPPEETRM